MSYEYLVPDYFPAFACKMGRCRRACCEGWPISFSMTDYFKLVGVECSPELRVKLDCALRLSDHPSPEAYAQISPRFDNQCPMRLDDGRCAIHAELGEDALAAVCRLYPRGIRANGVYECSCANSCEAVLELLLKKTEPITFEKTALPFTAPGSPDGQGESDAAVKEQRIRLWCISRIQDRRYSLPQRIAWLGDSLLAMEQALKAKDTRRMEALLSGQEAVPVPESIEPGQEPLALGLEVANHMLRILDERSDSIRAYGEAELAYLGDGDGECQRYMDSCGRFRELMPQWEIWFEHMLVNHMFFTQFPFLHHPVAMEDEFLGLSAVYALLRFLCVGRTAEACGTEEIVDVAAGAFRLMDHTDFERMAAHILKKLGYHDRQHIWQFLHL